MEALNSSQQKLAEITHILAEGTPTSDIALLVDKMMDDARDVRAYFNKVKQQLPDDSIARLKSDIATLEDSLKAKDVLLKETVEEMKKWEDEIAIVGNAADNEK